MIPGGEFTRVAVIGSRTLSISDLGEYLPEGVTEIVSGGARGVDASARKYARANGIPLKEFYPDYDRLGESAPLMRNLEIIRYADMVLAFWDGKSGGTYYVIRNCKEMNVPVRVIRYDMSMKGRGKV